MKKKIFLIFALLFALTACSDEKAEVNKYDNSSYYYGNVHRLVEVEDGYYNLYHNLLTFVDRESLEPYLVSNEKYSIEDLMGNEVYKTESDAYFENADSVFYENDKVYVTSPFEVHQVDVKNNTKKTISTPGHTSTRTLHEGVLYSIVDYEDADLGHYSALEKLEFSKDKPEQLLNLDEKIQELGFDEGQFQTIYFQGDKAYLQALVNKNSTSIPFLFELNLHSKELTPVQQPRENYELANFYFSDGKLYLTNSYIDKEDENAWMKKGKLVEEINPENKEVVNQVELDPLKDVVYSNEKSIETSFNALSYYKSYGFGQEDLRQMDYVIKDGDQQMTLPEDLFKPNSGFLVRLSDLGDILLSYESGDLAVIRDGEIHEIYK